MSLVHTTYGKLRPFIPPNARRYARIGAEWLWDVSATKSFSQFGEDAVLRAYFATEQVGAGGTSAQDGARYAFAPQKLRPGFYVDVGAYSPKQLSNTFSFYKLGWRGINIDATPGSMKAFDVIRRHDINVEAVISVDPGTHTLYSWGLPSTINTLSADLAQAWTEELGTAPTEMSIQTVTLSSVLDKHLPPGQRIDFLTIDAEGHDLEVLRSNDWDRYRPELVVVEQMSDELVTTQHSEGLNKLQQSEVAAFMGEIGYEPHAWVPPSVIYKSIR